MMEKAVRVSGRNNINYDFMIVTYASILMKTNHSGQALEYLNHEISKSPSFAPAWATRAELQCRRGELAAGRADADTALRLDPHDARAQQVLQGLNASTTPSDYSLAH
jgi:predicted Zn-dependent protease